MSGFEQLWQSQVSIGRVSTGGYQRFAWTAADLECRAWFREQAGARGLAVEQDRNGNLWGWWGDPEAGDAVVTGSHLDSVPDGGAYDGPLGVVSSFAALDVLRARGVTPRRPIAVACFSDEEGARFGVACMGSRLATGVLAPDRARALRDADGVTLAEAMAAAGADPGALGPDEALLGRLGCFVELHVEQGRGLVDLDAPVGVASRIWPHGRYRFEFAGAANHAGTTRLVDRRDAMLPAAATVLAARRLAEEQGAHATVGRLLVDPNGTNAIPSRVRAWLDARAPEEATVRRLVDALGEAARAAADEHEVSVAVTEESWTPTVEFESGERSLTATVREVLSRRDGGGSGTVSESGPAPMSMSTPVPVLPTGAGHDAGILAGTLPTAMIFVRNPSGVSHAPDEHAEMVDCLVGVDALADVLEHLSCR